MNSLMLTTSSQLIMPDEMGQLVLQLTDPVRVMRAVVGEGAIITAIYAGRHVEKLGEDNGAAKVAMGESLQEMALAGGEGVQLEGSAYVVVIAKNVSHQPMLLNANVFLLSQKELVAPVEVVASTPPPQPAAGSRNPAPAQGQPHAGHRMVMGAPKSVPVNIPDVTKTAADLGISPGANEVAVLMTRNEANFLVHTLRTNAPLDDIIKYGIIRRLDTALKT